MVIKKRNFIGAFLLLAAASAAQAGAPTLRVEPEAPVIGLGGAAFDVLQVIYDPDGADGPTLPIRVSTSASFVSSSPGVAAVAVSSIVDITGGVLLGVSDGSANVTVSYAGLNAVSAVKVAGSTAWHNIQTPDGRTRSYLLYVPAGAAGALPLVLNYHGYATFTTGLGQMILSQMNAVADREKFAVAYPAGAGDIFGIPAWNSGFGASVPVDDVEFTRRMIADIKTKITVNADKIYAAGLSNGGMMSQRLGCELSDQIAAIACVAGSMTFGGDFQTCSPRRVVPVIQIHGVTDPLHPYGLAEAAVAGWLARNRISQKAKQVTYSNGIATCETYTASPTNLVTFCSINPPVRLAGPRAPAAWEAAKSLQVPRTAAPGASFLDAVSNLPDIIYDGGGHSWPGGVSLPGMDSTTHDMSASQAMWDFFEPLSLTPAAAQAPALTVKAYPNPFRPNKGDTAVGFTNVPPGGRVRVYTVAGELVRDLPGSMIGAIYWDGKNAAGEAVASGVYTCLVEGAGETKKMKVAVQR